MIFLPKCRALCVVLEKGHGAREKGHGAGEKGHGVAPCLKWQGERLVQLELKSRLGLQTVFLEIMYFDINISEYTNKKGIRL